MKTTFMFEKVPWENENIDMACFWSQQSSESIIRAVNISPKFVQFLDFFSIEIKSKFVFRSFENPFDVPE